MARDYKSRAHAQPKKKAPTPGWVWFLSGLLVGLFVAGLVWLKVGFSTPDTTSQHAGASTEKKAAAPAPVETKSSPPKPRFDFYTVLPEMEVVVPEPEPEETISTGAPVVEGTPVEVAKPASAKSYMLQMGSFRKYEDADRMRASLALVGIEAEIQRVNINNQDTFHRVRSGPYRSRAEVNEVRARLQKNKINSLLIKLK